MYEKFHAKEIEVKTHGKKPKNAKKEKGNKGSGRAAGVVKGAGLKSQLKKKKSKVKEKNS
jgi:hypothetical protein